MQDLDKLYLLAEQYFNPKEYAQFIDLLNILNSRLSNITIPASNISDKDIKYPYEIEIMLNMKIFRHDQLGQRVELEKCLEIPFLKKIPIGQEPSSVVNSINNAIDNV